MAVLIHISIVLGARGFDNTLFARRLQGFPYNIARVVSPELIQNQGGLLFDPSVQYALCRFNLSGGGVEVTVPNEAQYWSAAIYTLSGRQFHAISNRNAKDPSVTFVIMNADVFDGLISAYGRNRLRRRSVRAPENEGFVLFRFGVDRPSSHARTYDALSKVKCVELRQRNPRSIQEIETPGAEPVSATTSESPV